MVKKPLRIMLLALGSIMIAACSSQGAFEYRDTTEIAPGPGLVSGSDGAVFSLGPELTGLENRDRGPSDFVKWKEEFERSSEARQYEMWLQLESY